MRLAIPIKIKSYRFKAVLIAYYQRLISDIYIFYDPIIENSYRTNPVKNLNLKHMQYILKSSSPFQDSKKEIEVSLKYHIIYNFKKNSKNLKKKWQ